MKDYISTGIAVAATIASLATVALSQAPASSSPATGLNQLTVAEKRAGWKLLFDGKSLAGWRGYKRPASETRWKVEDGMLTIDPNDGKDTRGARDIITDETYDRFELAWEWRVAPGGNSGLKYFVLEDMDAAIGHEYQMIDDERHPDAKIGPHRQTAAFYDVLPVSVAPTILEKIKKPAGEWNESKVRVDVCRPQKQGTCVYHYLNNIRVLEYQLDSPELRAAIAKSKFKDVARFGKLHKAHILIQDHGDRVWYRNIKIHPLGGPTTPSSSASAAASNGTQVVANEAERRVDIAIDGKPFTSYIYPEALKKPVLYPIRTSRGTVVTRGFPLEPGPGERVDHPANPNAPTYWHARGYGLFAANGLGRKVFKQDEEELVLTLDPGKSMTYRHRVVVVSGAAMADSIEREFRTFTAAASSN